MILSRVIEHVKDQNWTAIVIDFVIVVVGVFIGIQLGNWNEARSDARLGREYVKRLSRDLNEDLAHVCTDLRVTSASFATRRCSPISRSSTRRC